MSTRSRHAVFSEDGRLIRETLGQDAAASVEDTTSLTTQLGIRPPGSFRALDYTLGGPLNPVLPDGSPSVDFLLVDVPQNRIEEYNVDGIGTLTTVSARLGGNYNPAENFVLTLGQRATVTLGSGNDVVLSSQVWFIDLGGHTTYQLPESRIDGGAGMDAIEVQANSSLVIALKSSSPFSGGSTFTSVEALQFAPDALPTQRQEMLLSLPPTGSIPFTRVIGSPGIDVLQIDVFDDGLPPVPGGFTLDLRTMNFDGFGDTPPLLVGNNLFVERVSVNFSPGSTVGSLSSLFANPDAATYVFSARTDSVLVGSSQDDWFNLPAQGQGSQFVNGGGGSLDVAFLPGPHTAYRYWPGGTVHGQSVEFRLQDLRPIVAPDVDGFVNIELLGFSDGYFTPAQLAAGVVPELPTISFDLAAAQAAVNEGTPPQAGGTIVATLERSGDLNRTSVVSWRLVPDSPVGHPATADDLGLVFGQIYTATFTVGQARLDLQVPLVADSLQESNETFYIELTGAVGAKLGADTLRQLVIVNDDAFDFSLAAAASSDEGAPYLLTITPASTFGFFGADDYRIDWGDGSAPELLSAAQLGASNGQVAHVFADGASAGTPTMVTVTAGLANNGINPTHDHAVVVRDVAPTMAANGSTLADSSDVYALHLGTYTDPGNDPLQSVRIDWGDGTQSALAPGGTLAYHVWGALGSRQIKVYAGNDDGEFLVDNHPVAVTASTGYAPPNGTAYQWLSAWSDGLISFSHKANLGNPAEPWSAVSLGAINSGVLAGGDLYGGLLGVSGRTLLSSCVRQEIDGTEALRVELGPHHANAVVLDLARLFIIDSPGLHEAGRVLFYDGATQVGSQQFSASQANGRLHLELSGLSPFTSLVLQAGAFIDANNPTQFVPGGLVDALGNHMAGPNGSGSEFMLEGVQFRFDDPPVPAPAVLLDLVGLPAAGVGAFAGFGG